MSDVLQYYNENSYISYPIKDNCSLETASFFILPSDWILDIQLVAKNSSIRRVGITELIKSSTNFTITFYDIENLVTLISITVLASSLQTGEFFSSSNSGVAVKIVPGAGLVTALAGSDFSHTFTSTNTELVSSAIILKGADVTSFTDGVDSLTADDAEWIEGDNIDFDNIDSEIGVSVVPTGEYDGCAIYADTIKKISGVIGRDGKFFLNAGDCYHWVGVVNGLELTNDCLPPCNPQDFVNVGHYMNRLNDGLIQLNDLSDTLQTQVQDNLDDFVNGASTLPESIAARTEPSVCVTAFYDASGPSNILRVLINFFNPGQSIVTGSLTLAAGDNVFPETAGTMFSCDRALPISPAQFSGRALSCKTSEALRINVDITSGGSGVDYDLTATYTYTGASGSPKSSTYNLEKFL